MEQALYTVRSVTQRLQICRATVYRMISRGELEVVKIGKATRITSASVDKMIRDQNPSWSADDNAVPPSAQRQGTPKAEVEARGRARERDLEKQVAALEREVARLRKLLSKVKEAINEYT
jgi:excisionase family DNA binding protein